MKTWIPGGIPGPIRKLFEVQGNESKHRLKHRFFQPSIAAPTHAMLLFGVCEDTLNCFLTLSIQRTIHNCMSEMLYLIHRLLPEMAMDDFSMVATLRTLREKRTCLAHKRIRDIFTVPVSRRRSITENLIVFT